MAGRVWRYGRGFTRAGRRALVVTDLADLRGPVSGTVRLPLWLYWSGPGPAFDLGEPFLRRWLYEIVPREAASPEDLTSYLGGTLIALWPDLYLPKGVRQAWEELHPVLRAARPAMCRVRTTVQVTRGVILPGLFPSAPCRHHRGQAHHRRGAGEVDDSLIQG